MLLLLAIACTSPATDSGGGAAASGDDGGTAGADTGPSAWSLDSGAAGDDTIDAAAAQASVQALVDRVRGFVARPVIAGYREVRTMGFDPCPNEAVTGTGEFGTTYYWDGLCETPDGVGFNGPMTDWRFEGIDIIGGMDFVYQRNITAPGGFFWSGEGLQGQTDVYDREDSFHFNCSCTAVQAEGADPDGRRAWVSMLDGAREWTVASDEVLDPDLGIQLTMWATQETDGGREFTMTGKLSAFDEGVGTGAFHLSLSQDAAGTCTVDGEDIAMELRETRTGHWVDVVFPEEDQPCEALCGDFPDGQQLCVDLRPLLAWEGEGPW